jgi:hypothetical protein
VKTHISPGSLPLHRPSVAEPAAREPKRESTRVRKQTVRFAPSGDCRKDSIRCIYFYFLVFVGTGLVTTKAIISHCCNMLINLRQLPTTSCRYFFFILPCTPLLLHLAAIIPFYIAAADANCSFAGHRRRLLRTYCYRRRPKIPSSAAPSFMWLRSS